MCSKKNCFGNGKAKMHILQLLGDACIVACRPFAHNATQAKCFSHTGETAYVGGTDRRRGRLRACGDDRSYWAHHRCGHRSPIEQPPAGNILRAKRSPFVTQRAVAAGQEIPDGCGAGRAAADTISQPIVASAALCVVTVVRVRPIATLGSASLTVRGVRPRCLLFFFFAVVM